MILASALLAVASFAPPQANPCTAAIAPGAPIVVARAGTAVTYAVAIPDFTNIWHDASTKTDYPWVSDMQFGFFASEAPAQTDTPVGGPLTLTKSQFTLIAGTTDCYQTSVATPTLTSGTKYVVGLRARRDVIGTDPVKFSTWGFSVDGPFLSAPPALPSPVGLRRK